MIDRNAAAAFGCSRGARPARGFTLVELMVTVAVLGILAAVAVPAMTGLINSNRLAGTTGELTAGLQLARSEALRRGARVRICGTVDGVNCGANWSRWIITGVDNTSGVTETIRDAASPATVQTAGPAGGIVFRPSGLIDAQQQLTVCIPTTSPAENRRVVTVMISGTIVTTRANGGGSCG